MSKFLYKTEVYIWIFRVKGFEVIDYNFVLCIAEYQLLLMAEARSYGVLFEFNAFDYFICIGVDMVEDATTYNCIYCFVLPLPNCIHWATRLKNCLWLTCLSRKLITETFQVLMVLSYEPLTSVLPSTKRLQTLLVCPINWFKISPWLVKLHSTILPSSKLPNTVF